MTKNLSMQLMDHNCDPLVHFKKCWMVEWVTNHNKANDVWWRCEYLPEVKENLRKVEFQVFHRSEPSNKSKSRSWLPAKSFGGQHLLQDHSRPLSPLTSTWKRILQSSKKRTNNLVWVNYLLRLWVADSVGYYLFPDSLFQLPLSYHTEFPLYSTDLHWSILSSFEIIYEPTLIWSECRIRCE